MTTYFDTNVLIYALCSNVDNISQQEVSVKLLEKAIINQNIILSELILCEFAFISKKLKENSNTIIQNLEFLSQYVKISNYSLNQRIIEIIKETKLFTSSFDIFHLTFCENHNCKLVTFDKGFKKFKNISNVEIVLL